MGPSPSTHSAAARLNTDPDILAEARVTPPSTERDDDDDDVTTTNDGTAASSRFATMSMDEPLHASLKVVGGSHRATLASAALLEQAGGLAALRTMTDAFYHKMFKDPHLVRGTPLVA